jgi:hypothetical protein
VTHAVRGKVVVQDGNIKPLVGSSVEFELETDPLVRAYGEIGADGSFELMRLHQGRERSGAVEGTYRVRIVPKSEDEDVAKWERARPIHPRFEEFKTSGLSFSVPTSGEITVQVSRK